MWTFEKSLEGGELLVVKKNIFHKSLKISIFTWNVGLLVNDDVLPRSKITFHKSEIIQNSEHLGVAD